MTPNWTQEAASLLASCKVTVPASSPELEVAVVGPYDSGKSTLLKRLLIDAAEPVPSWLTVSAREETHQTNVVDLRGIHLIDTPGLGALSEEHQALTLGAVLRADVLLLVVPPRLVGDDAVLKQIISGQLFHPDAWPWPSGGLIVAISRFDEAGPDAEEDPEEYAALAQRKTDELHELLATFPLPMEPPVHVIAADPFQMAFAPQGSVEASLFDSYRSWDGIAALQERVFSLPDRAGSLRKAATVRRVLYGLSLLVARLAEEKAEADRQQEINGEAADQLRSRLRDVEELDARSRKRLLTEMREATSGVLSTDQLMHEDVQERLFKAVDIWSKVMVPELRRLAADLQADIRELEVDVEGYITAFESPQFFNPIDDWTQPLAQSIDVLGEVISVLNQLKGIPGELPPKIDAWLTGADNAFSPELTTKVVGIAVALGEVHADKEYRRKDRATRDRIREELASATHDILQGPWAEAITELKGALSDTVAKLELNTPDEVSWEPLRAGRRLLASAPLPDSADDPS